MRIFSLFLSGLLPLILAFPSWASEDALRQRILNHLRVATSQAEIHEPLSEIATLPTYGQDLYRSLVGEELYPRLVNAVVYIVTEEGVTGAGTVISSSFGLIITNWHVIGNEKVVGLVFKPRGSNGSISFEKDSIFFARVLTTDSIRDLALLEIVSRPGKVIAVPLGSTSNLAAGHEVFSVSHPRGSLWSYSEGTISQMTPRHEWVRGLGTVHRASTIQTQPVSQNGSSGDPLFDEDGQFIGVLVGGNVDEPNIAISIDEIREFVFSFLR
jgi:S1-C subfamily serine protease